VPRAAASRHGQSGKWSCCIGCGREEGVVDGQAQTCRAGGGDARVRAASPSRAAPRRGPLTPPCTDAARSLSPSQAAPLSSWSTLQHTELLEKKWYLPKRSAAHASRRGQSTNCPPGTVTVHLKPGAAEENFHRVAKMPEYCKKAKKGLEQRPGDA